MSRASGDQPRPFESETGSRIDVERTAGEAVERRPVGGFGQLHAADPEPPGRIARAVVHAHLRHRAAHGQRLERLVLEIECDQPVGQGDQDAAVRHRRRGTRAVVERDRPVLAAGRIQDVQRTTVDIDPEQMLRARASQRGPSPSSACSSIATSTLIQRSLHDDDGSGHRRRLGHRRSRGAPARRRRPRGGRHRRVARGGRSGRGRARRAARCSSTCATRSRSRPRWRTSTS